MFIYMNKKGQSTLEYALIIAVVVAVLLTMQGYFKRALQGKFKSVSDDIGEQYSTQSTDSRYTTITNIATHEVTQPGAAAALGVAGGGRGGITTTTTTHDVTRSGTEHTNNADDEYWPQ
ncbi:MAG: hypothetical protein KBA46_01185 [Candidatus Omnitrophica bacterium]|nr:hypothetical protein [Candidatus Omnitrophota bacterium]